MRYLLIVLALLMVSCAPVWKEPQLTREAQIQQQMYNAYYNFNDNKCADLLSNDEVLFYAHVWRYLFEAHTTLFPELYPIEFNIVIVSADSNKGMLYDQMNCLFSNFNLNILDRDSIGIALAEALFTQTGVTEKEIEKVNLSNATHILYDQIKDVKDELRFGHINNRKLIEIKTGKIIANMESRRIFFWSELE